MNQADVTELLQTALWIITIGAAPGVLAAMFVGTLIALFQALTQIQEMTITFVPKLIVMAAAIALTAHLVGGQVFAFTEQLYARIERGYGQ